MLYITFWWELWVTPVKYTYETPVNNVFTLQALLHNSLSFFYFNPYLSLLGIYVPEWYTHISINSSRALLSKQKSLIIRSITIITKKKCSIRPSLCAIWSQGWQTYVEYMIRSRRWKKARWLAFAVYAATAGTATLRYVPREVLGPWFGQDLQSTAAVKQARFSPSAFKVLIKRKIKKN